MGDGMSELVIDSFAGGGGASLGIEQALGRPVDIAINHDALAVAMHMTNHPGTRHYQQDIWSVKPREATKGRPVGLAWFSPDCKHFSKAKGGKPVEKSVRDLAWVVIDWAKDVRPRVIMLENVEEFRTWGPLDDDNMPIRDRKGETFQEWLAALRDLGYEVEWRELRACDYGAPTIRKRLFVIARCDGEAIQWPLATHGKHLEPYRTAAECLDFDIPCPSIFERSRPLADATMRRIANGIKRYVIDAAEPFIVNLTHGGRVEPVSEPFATITGAHRGEKALVAPYIVGAGGPEYSGKPVAVDEPFRTLTVENHRAVVAPFLASITHNQGGDGVISAGNRPVPTITTSKGGEQALIAPTLVQTGYGEREGQAPRSLDIGKPLGTIVGGAAKHALTAAFLAKHFGDRGQRPGSAIDEPTGTVTAVDHHSLVASNLVKLYGTAVGADVEEPMPTITAGGNHVAEVRAFLHDFYRSPTDGLPIQGPLRTLTTHERFGLVYVHGEPYEIVDIGMRMLTPRELFRAQGFPEGYIIDPIVEGKRLTKTAQIRMCGNSVVPACARALVEANVGRLGQQHAWPGYEMGALAAVGGGA
jgi:DNA (cytosine-5)-methyltransferase 1